MLLVFRDLGLDERKFPDLVTQRFRIFTLKSLASSPAGFWKEGDDFVAFLGGNERPFMFGVAGLPATFFLGLLFVAWRLGVWMLGARGKRRITGVLLEAGQFCFQLVNALFIIGETLFIVIDDTDDERLDVGRQSLQLFGRDGRLRQRHARYVADFSLCAKSNFTARLRRAVNGYRHRQARMELDGD